MCAAQNGLNGDPRIQAICDAIRVFPHFLRPGIITYDVTKLSLNHCAFQNAVDIFVERYGNMNISVVAGAKFIPLSKPEELPGKFRWLGMGSEGEVISESNELGDETQYLPMRVDAVLPGERAVIIDETVADDGVLSAAIRLLERAEARVIECACFTGLPEIEVVMVVGLNA